MTGPTPATAFTRRSGTVAEFDDHVGAGRIVDDEGVPWYLHCTAIADGSRSIRPGTRVAFTARPGPTGVEATAVVPA